VLECALAFFAAAVALRASGRPVGRGAAGRGAVAVVVFAILASAFAVLHIGSNENLKALLWRRSVVARRAYETAVFLTDRDGDGFSSFLAGADTDDANPAVNPLATEIPGNGVDDNCFGGDLAVAPPQRAAAVVPAAANGKRFVLIAIDTLRADRMSLYGYGRPTTPRIDEYARSGLVFDACSSAGTNTAVAFAAMQTSASRGGVFEPDRVRLFPRLAEAGYRTAQVNAVPEDMWLRAKSSSQPYRRVILDGIDEFPHEFGEEFWDADKVTDAAIEYFSALPPDAPSATWVHYFDPHTPRKKMAPFDFGDSASDMYDTEVAYADREVGRLLDWMQTSGLMKDTIVILMADHGEAFLEHGMDFHGNRPYAEQIHVPLVVWAPGLAPGRTASPASVVDIAPTVFDFVGLGPMPGAEGRSLLSPPPVRRPIFSETPLNIVDGPFHAFAVTDGGWKLIYDVIGNTTELYDLERDPRELHNLADLEPERVAAMRATLAGWLDTTRSVASASEARDLVGGD
jgi:arylsulfatase A-like enzyme